MPLLSDMTWEEVGEYLESDDRIILPIGATEEHGRHLGLGTDFLEAEAIAQGTSEATGVIVAPTVNYGESLAMMGFPGTISLQPTTLISVLDDLFTAFFRHGFRRVLVVNGHGGNTAALSNAAQMVSYNLPGLRLKYFQWWTDKEAYSVVTDMMGPQQGSHATAGETAFMLAIRPDAVKLERLTGNDAPVQPSREIVTEKLFSKIYPDGIMGLDPRDATSKAGAALLDKSVEICSHELMNWE